MRCPKCGNNYPDRLTACPKCGAHKRIERITSKLRNIKSLKYFTIGALLILTSIFIVYCWSEFECLVYCSWWQSLLMIAFVFVAPVAFIAGVILIISVLILFMLSIGYRRKEFWILLSLLAITATLIVKLIYGTTDSPDDYSRKGSLEDAISYAEKIVPLLDEFKNIAGIYPYSLEYLDVDIKSLLSPLTVHSVNPNGFYVSNKWIGYYPITKNDFALCVDERDINNNDYSDIMFSSLDRKWKNTDCNIYHREYKQQTGGAGRDAIVISKEAINRKSTLYTVEFQHGVTLDIVSMWSGFSAGECVKVYIPDNLHPRIASGGNCWK